MQKLVTDLAEIRSRAKQNEERNWAFRSKLKFMNIPARKLDGLVHRLHTEVSSRIDCRSCANCCKVMRPAVGQAAAGRIARHLGISSEAFKNEYLDFDREEQQYLMQRIPCPFLQENKCSLYELRPHDCRSFPHLHKNGFTSRLITVIHNYAICPIVFNVFERLKMELAHER
jgi:Fe-S-cluster containining protein